MWQSRVEIEHYSVAYFSCLTTFKALNFHRGWSSYVLRTVRRLIRYSSIFAAIMSPALSECFALQRFERGNVVELCNGILFDFYMGLPHIECLVSVESYTIPSLCQLQQLPQVWRLSPQCKELVLFTVCIYIVLSRAKVECTN